MPDDVTIQLVDMRRPGDNPAGYRQIILAEGLVGVLVDQGLKVNEALEVFAQAYVLVAHMNEMHGEGIEGLQAAQDMLRRPELFAVPATPETTQ